MALIKKVPVLLSVLLLPFIYTAYQYFVRDSLQVYDASSHLAQVWYLKEYLWPEISGFNSFNLLGFDQGLLYPSLFHYIAASLAFLVGVEIATKLVVIGAIILLPLSIYLFTSVFFVTRNSKVFVTSMLLVVLIALPGYFGANIKSLVQLGLLPSFVSLPFVILYLWALLKPKPSWVMTAILLAIIILTHLVAGIFCSLATLSFIISQLLVKRFSFSLLKPLIFALGLAGFFLLPFIFNLDLLSQSVHLPSLFLPNLAVLLFLFFTFLFLWRGGKEKLYPLVILGLILAVLVVVDATVLRYFNSGFLFEKIYNLHLYRYQVYLYLITTVLIVYWPSRFLFEFPRRAKVRPKFVVVLPILVVFFAVFVRTPFLVDQVKVEVADQGTRGRFIEIFSREDSYPFIYSSQNKLVLEKKKPWAYGLFTDATPNGPYLSSLIKSFDPFFKKNSKEVFVESKSLDRAKLYDALNLFGIENLLFLDPSNESGQAAISTRVLKSGVGQSLVEIPSWKLIKAKGNWENEVEKWWFAKGKFDSLLVENFEGKTNTTRFLSIKNLKNSKNWTNFSFEVDSAEKVPILVKFTHLPGWGAKANGEKIKIHKASPNLMLVYATGNIEFTYSKLWYSKFGTLISLFTGITLALLVLRKLITRNVKR